MTCNGGSHLHGLALMLATNWRRWWEQVTSNIVSMLFVAFLSAAIGWFVHGQQVQDDRLTAIEATLKVLVKQHAGDTHAEPRQPPD